MKKIVKLVLSLLLVLVVVFVAWFFLAIRNDKPPKFFPFNNQTGIYSIVKDTNGLFTVLYKGPSTYLSQTGDKSVSVVIGETKYDLNQFLNKDIVISKGDFQNGFSEQCVAGKCVPIVGGPYAVVIIDEMYVRQ